MNPFLFHQIRAHFSQTRYVPTWEDLMRYFDVYINAAPPDMSMKSRVNKLKQLFGFFFKGSPKLLEKRQTILSASYEDPDSFFQFAKTLLSESCEGFHAIA